MAGDGEWKAELSKVARNFSGPLLWLGIGRYCLHHLAYLYHGEPLLPLYALRMSKRFCCEFLLVELLSRAFCIPLFVHGPHLYRVPKMIRQVATTQHRTAYIFHLHKRNAHLTIMGVLTRPLRDTCLSNSTHLQDAAKREVMFLRLGWPKTRKNRILFCSMSSFPSLYLRGFTKTLVHTGPSRWILRCQLWGGWTKRTIDHEGREGETGRFCVYSERRGRVPLLL